MRTTVDLEDSLIRRAKSVAAEHGEPLKKLIGRAIARELGAPDNIKTSTLPKRVELPLIGGRRNKKYAFSGKDLERILADEDSRPYDGRKGK